MLRYLLIILRYSAYVMRTTMGGKTISEKQMNTLMLRKYAGDIAVRIESHLCSIMSGRAFTERLNRHQLVEIASNCHELDCTCSQALDVVVKTVQEALEPGYSGHIKIEGSIEEGGIPMITAHPPHG